MLKCITGMWVSVQHTNFIWSPCNTQDACHFLPGFNIEFDAWVWHITWAWPETIENTPRIEWTFLFKSTPSRSFWVCAVSGGNAIYGVSAITNFVKCIFFSYIELKFSEAQVSSAPVVQFHHFRRSLQFPPTHKGLVNTNCLFFQTDHQNNVQKIFMSSVETDKNKLYTYCNFIKP